ncbi:MAG: alpha/beta hydrolase fold domain-containing protein [Verrucomicrobiota bacterium]
MRGLFLSFFASIALISLAYSQSSSIEEWRQADTDGDGALSREEVPAALRPYFDRVDTNSDAKLDPTELEAIARRLQQANRSKKSAPPIELPEGVVLRKDEAYREGHDRWKVDVYLPEEPAPEGGRPGLVFVHGGGWRGGSKDRGNWASLPARYAAEGYVCISVNYRLVGDGGGFPECIHDVKNAVRWFRAHAGELGLDPDRIGAYGNSAGAHLVSMLGLTGPEADLEGDGTFLDQSSLVQAVAAAATPSDFLSWKGEPFPNGGPLEGDEATWQERAEEASPVHHASEKAPPFLLFHAKNDSIVPFRQGEVLAQALEPAGAKDVKFMAFDDGGHGVFGQKREETQPAMDAFFARILKPIE